MAFLRSWIPSNIGDLLAGSSSNTAGAEIDTNQIAYVPGNSEHNDFIKRKITLFNQSSRKLAQTDMAIGAVGADILLWLTGATSWRETLVLGAGIYFYAWLVKQLEPLSRPTQSKVFQEQLSELTALYTWCTKDTDNRFTHDPVLLALLNTIAPFVSTSMLVRDNLLRGNGTISDDFMEILAKPPHRVQFVMPQSANVRIAADKDHPVLRLGKVTLFEAKRVLYGVNEERAPSHEVEVHTKKS